MAKSLKTRQRPYLGPLAVAIIVGILVYVLLNLSADKQWSLIGALAVFAVTFIVPVMQTTYAARMNERDAARYAREEAERLKAPDLRVTLQDGNSIEMWPSGDIARGTARSPSTCSSRTSVTRRPKTSLCASVCHRGGTK
jgi:hypothetical protein